jgi:hypothetical protein
LIKRNHALEACARCNPLEGTSAPQMTRERSLGPDRRNLGSEVKWRTTLPTVFGSSIQPRLFTPPPLRRCPNKPNQVLEPTQGAMFLPENCQSSRVLLMLRDQQLICCLLRFLTYHRRNAFAARFMAPGNVQRTLQRLRGYTHIHEMRMVFTATSLEEALSGKVLKNPTRFQNLVFLNNLNTGRDVVSRMLPCQLADDEKRYLAATFCVDKVHYDGNDRVTIRRCPQIKRNMNA